MTRDINININLFPWQSDTLKLMEEHNGKIIVVKSRRQVGKSILCEFAALKYCLSSNNTNVYYLLPTYKQALKVFNEIRDIVSNKFFVQKINSSEFYIKFINGSIFQMFSGLMSLAALQGWTVKRNGLLILDELAYLDEETVQTVMPWCNTNNPTILAVSTPLFQQGTFYDFWCQGIDESNKEVFAIDYSKYDTSMLLTQSKLDYYKKNLPAIKFKQMYEGEFAAAEGSVFGDFSQCLYGNDYSPDSQNVVFGIDWSSNVGQDYNAITIMNLNKEIVDIIAFNDKEATFTIDLIVKLADEYKPKKIVCEKNSIGNIYIELLRKALKNRRLDCPVLDFVTTNQSKSDIISILQVAIQNNEIKMPKRDDLMIQLSHYEMTVNANNKPIYNSASGFHDDIIMSLAIALNAITVKKKSTFI